MTVSAMTGSIEDFKACPEAVVVGGAAVDAGVSHPLVAIRFLNHVAESLALRGLAGSLKST